jgi:lipopolysaccharide heptosyltransferase II
MSSSIPMQRLQRADRTLGRLVLPLVWPLRWLRAAPVRREQERCLLIKFWGLGSLQLLMPSVQHLRRTRPGARIDLLTLEQNREFAAGLEAFDAVLTLDVEGCGWTRLWLRIAGLVRRLRRAGYDRVYDFEFLTRFSAVLSLLSGAPRTYGFTSPETRRADLHTERVPFNRYWHVARNFCSLAGGENGSEVWPEEVRPFRILPAHRSEATAALFERGLATDGPLVVLNPNAGSLSLERCWPPERFSELARRLIAREGARVVLIGSAAERPRCAAIAQGAGSPAPGRLLDLSGVLSIGALAALLDGAQLFVTNDSGPMHVCAALGTPTIGLFGPETPQMYAPLGLRTRWLYRPPPCSPCINVHDNKLAVCVRGRAECMTNLGVELVWEAVRDELRHPPAPRTSRQLRFGR